MSEHSLQKCRTCLKSSTKLISLTKHATGNNPSRNYGQLLKEFATLDCIADYEHLMPQYLCKSCCRGLRNSYAFIKQAQYCNNKLINDISKQLDCLQEKTIDLPENANYLEKSIEIKLEKNYVNSQKEQNIKTKEHGFNDINLQLEVKIDKTLDCNGDDGVKRNIINKQNLNDASTLTTSKLPLIQDEIIQNEKEDSSSDPLIEKIIECHTTSGFNTKMYDDKEQFSDEEFVRNLKKMETKSSSESLARRCEECGNIYKNYRSLYCHQKDVHRSEDKYSICPHCGKKYKRKFDLRTHIDKAHNENSTEMVKQPPRVKDKRFMCTECSYVCTTITILNIHVNRHHTGEKPYKCDICFKSFVIPHKLKTHRYLHTGERPYKCPICSKGFRDSSHMVRHKHIHSSERPYKCKDCNKSFTQSYNLSVHKRTHLKEKKLNCTICEKVFVNMSLLNIHRISENHHDEVI